jgi:hypothetical protein
MFDRTLNDGTKNNNQNLEFCGRIYTVDPVLGWFSRKLGPKIRALYDYIPGTLTDGRDSAELTRKISSLFGSEVNLRASAASGQVGPLILQTH